MAPKTSEGKWRKDVFLDGRLSENREFERQTGRRKELPSKIKREKKQQEKLKNLHKIIK